MADRNSTLARLNTPTVWRQWSLAPGRKYTVPTVSGLCAVLTVPVGGGEGFTLPLPKWLPRELRRWVEAGGKGADYTLLHVGTRSPHEPFTPHMYDGLLWAAEWGVDGIILDNLPEVHPNSHLEFSRFALRARDHGLVIVSEANRIDPFVHSIADATRVYAPTYKEREGSSSHYQIGGELPVLINAIPRKGIPTGEAIDVQRLGWQYAHDGAHVIAAHHDEEYIAELAKVFAEMVTT